MMIFYQKYDYSFYFVYDRFVTGARFLPLLR